ncbi:MAG: hypothetical protein B7Y25_03910 [Alphaproteobacteria bacterium 16-39-46]|nr:MAG: hypothetical protein B7Y25_03910 [Alphaproteobacteria bacterium 16-39-46]OZA43128.1 MAG: hypothetical protein B7X84_04065 [Alphaproteobacteria bacterium 17-39-52]HQS84029.1 hypothetical protein [Alphaproteobacteria bacterium]HQS93628.1 hypothetical protein [Alphaproteobacteria bacterium]
MDYNLSSAFKDVLKVISLGVMASINGVSGDVFAMDDEWGARAPAPFSLATVRSFQGDLDPEMLAQFALEDSMALLRVGGRPHSPAREMAAFHNQGARPRGAAAAAEDEDFKLAQAMQLEDELNAGLHPEGAHPRGAAAAAAAEEDRNYALALEFEEKLKVGIVDQDAYPRGAAAAAASDEEARNYALALKFQEELNAGIVDQGAYPRGAAAAAPKANAKGWNVDPSALLHQHWEKHQIEGEGFVTYISKQAVAVYQQLGRERQNDFPFDRNAIREIAVRLKTFNTGDGVSAKIDKVLADLL